MKIFIFPFPTAAAICALLPSRSALASIVSHSLPLNTANDTILRASKNFSSKAPGWRTMISSLRVHGARSAFFAPPSSYSARGKNPLGAISATTVKAFAGELKSPGKATAEAFSMTFLETVSLNTAISLSGFAESDTFTTGSAFLYMPWSFQSHMNPPWNMGSLRASSQ